MHHCVICTLKVFCQAAIVVFSQMEAELVGVTHGSVVIVDVN